MPYSVTIDTQEDEVGGGWFINDIQTIPTEFITRTIADGGVFVPLDGDLSVFIPYEEIKRLWFDSEKHVCDHHKEEENPNLQTAAKDLTIN